jgi:hypothetical protein
MDLFFLNFQTTLHNFLNSTFGNLTANLGKIHTIRDVPYLTIGLGKIPNQTNNLKRCIM